MPLATKNNAIIVTGGKVAENCGCCGGWYCLPCETITPHGYSTSTFSDGCWGGAGGTENPLTFGNGHRSRCMTLNNEGDITISISAAVTPTPRDRGTAAVCIGDQPDSFNSSGGVGFRIVAGYAFGFGSGGADRAQVFGGGTVPVTFADANFAGTISALFKRRGGNWFVSMPGLPEVAAIIPLPSQGYLYHGVSGTVTGLTSEYKVFSSYSVTVS